MAALLVNMCSRTGLPKLGLRKNSLFRLPALLAGSNPRSLSSNGAAAGGVLLRCRCAAPTALVRLCRPGRSNHDYRQVVGSINGVSSASVSFIRFVSSKTPEKPSLTAEILKSKMPTGETASSSRADASPKAAAAGVGLEAPTTDGGKSKDSNNKWFSAKHGWKLGLAFLGVSGVLACVSVLIVWGKRVFFRNYFINLSVLMYFTRL